MKKKQTVKFEPGMTCAFCKRMMFRNYRGAVRDGDTFAHVACANGRPGEWEKFSTINPPEIPTDANITAI